MKSDFILFILIFSSLIFISDAIHVRPDTQLLSSRRNHACAILPATESSAAKAVLIGGRWSPTIEMIDLETFEHQLIAEDSMLGSHHNAVEIVAGYEDPSDLELWVMCGFSGREINNEVNNDHVIIISTKTGRISQGPRFPQPLGACSSVQIGAPIDGYEWTPRTWTPQYRREQEARGNWLEGRFLCIVGGFQGTHNKGESLSGVNCWDRVGQQWVALPSLPRSSDHHNTVYLSHTMCPECQDSIVMLYPRNGPYQQDIPAVQQLILGESEWQTWPVASGETRSAAAVAMTREGIAVTFGGISYYNKKVPGSKSALYKTLQLFDLPNRRICSPTNTTLAHAKWALFACSSPDSDLVIICGGASMKQKDKHKNHHLCEYFDVRSIIDQECAGN